MKRIRINKGQIGLVFRNGDYIRVLQEGSFWLKPFESVMLYSLSVPFYPPVDLSILLRDEDLATMLTVVDVKDHEIALQYENGNFKNVLTPGRYAFWKGVAEFSFDKADLNRAEISPDINVNLFQRKELLPYIRVYTIEAFEKGVLFVDGNFQRILDTGVYHFWKSPVMVSVQKTDMRQLQLEVSGQEILTRDKAALRISFYTQYKVKDIIKALVENRDFEKQLYVLLQLALREFVGTYSLDELLDKKEEISAYVLSSLKQKSEDLGVEIKGAGIRDIILPGEIKEIMNQVLVAEKKAQANVIMRREETASTRSLLNTAKLMEDNECCSG
ncbi:slipin family protein [Cytophagaceae bacterium ABcell3]|nr:slipin family protein [Cytophagaceae bacterium ABcell3]